MPHQIREKCHVVGHFHTSGDSNWFTGEKTVPSYDGWKNTYPQKCQHFHFLQIPGFTTWLGLIALFILRLSSRKKMFKLLFHYFAILPFGRKLFSWNELWVNYCKNNQERACATSVIHSKADIKVQRLRFSPWVTNAGKTTENSVLSRYSSPALAQNTESAEEVSSLGNPWWSLWGGQRMSEVEGKKVTLGLIIR